MAIPRSFLVGIISSASIFLAPSQMIIAQAQLAPQEISVIAKPITVRIDGVNEGSGVIIDKSDNTYTVITNWHVVRVLGNYTVQTYDGQKHAVDYRQTQEFPESTDLAIIKFTSENDYEVANLGDSEALGEGQTIHLAGYPGSDQILGESDRFYRFNSLSINAILPDGREGGYSLAYGGENFSGMSGSPILNSDGEVIGINGTAYVDVDGKARANYAIPIHIYQELATSLDSQQQENASSFPDFLVPSDSSTSGEDLLVTEKLQAVPVFTIADDEGAPLIAKGKDGNNIAGVFISQQDANQFIDKLGIENPDLATKVRVVPVSLGEVYKLAKSAQSQENPLDFTYVAQESSVSDAKSLLAAQGEEYEGGVPLFVARAGENGGFLTIEQNGEQIIPFFFQLSQLEDLIQRFKEQEPEIADNVDIAVLPLEGVIENLASKEDKTLEKIVLVPSTESIEFLQNVSQK